MKEKIVTKLKTKFETTVKSAIHRAAPIVKKEVAKTVDKGKNDIFETALTVVKIGAFIFAISNIGGGKGIPLIAEKVEEMPRTFNITYNEVHSTCNFYLKGEN